MAFGVSLQALTNFSEALHLSDRERQIILDCFSKIKYDLEHAVDKHSKDINSVKHRIVPELLRTVLRPAIHHPDNTNKGILERFVTLLNEFFSSDKPQEVGLPSVSWCANKFNLSANYFGDLIKKETGKSANEYIHLKLIDEAKAKIFDKEKSVSEIAYELGFKYPQHFNRLFKQHTGVTPLEYRSSMN